MSDNTIIQQGFFTSTGMMQTISLRSGVDWMRVYNSSIAAANQTTAVGVEFYWQNGFPVGAQWEYLKSNATNAANLSQYLTSGGFTYIDSSLFNYGATNPTITAISTALQPVVTNSGTNGLIAGQTVRIFNESGAPQVNSIDYTVGQGTLSSTTFSLDYAAKLSVAGTTGSWMLVNSTALFYPSLRYVGIMASDGPGLTAITLTVTHNYQVGQTVRLNVGPAYGVWSTLNGMLGTIVSASSTYPNNEIVVNIDSSSLAAFVSPLAAAVPFTAATVVPVGENTSVAESNNVNIVSDATLNTGYIGMNLAAGVNSPAGVSGNVIYWQAGKSFSNNGM